MMTAHRHVLVLCCLGLVLGLVGCTAPEPAMHIGPQLPVTVVTPANPIGSERLAVDELSTYLEKITGSKPTVGVAGPVRPVVPTILVARADRAPAWAPQVELPDQHILLKTDGPVLSLLGGGHKGVLFATYTFLEDVCGVHWLFPGPEGEVVPQTPLLAVPHLARREGPDFEHRSIMDQRMQVHGHRIMWMLRNRMTPERGRTRRVAAWDMLKTKYGLKASDVGSNRLVGHIFKRMMRPLDKRFEQHPEWFPTFHGMHFPGGRNRMQPTLHAPGFKEFALAYLRKELDQDPDITSLSLCPNDGFNGWGIAPEDTRWDGPDMWGALPVVTDRLLHFVTVCADELAKSHPGEHVYTYAYTMRYKQPPKRITELPPNVDIDLVHQYNAHCDHLTAIDDPTSEANRNFAWMVPAWRKIVKGKLIYRNHQCLAMQGLIFPTWRQVQPTYRFLKKHNVDGLEHGAHRAYGQNGLTVWLTMKLAWNVDADVQALKEQYCRIAYGPQAGPVMVRYWDRLARAARESGVEVSPGGLHHRAPYIFTPEVQADLRAILEQAEAVVKGKQHAWMLGLARLGFDTHSAALQRELAARGIDYTLDRDAGTVTQVGKDDTLDALEAFDESVEKLPQYPYVTPVVDKRRKKGASKKPKQLDVVIIATKQIEVIVAPAAMRPVMQVTDRATGTHCMRGFGGGYADSMGPYFGWHEWGLRGVDYKVLQTTPTSITLQADCPNGVRYTRTFSVDGNRLNIEQKAENIGKETAVFHFLTNPLFRLGDRMTGEMGYVWQDGAWRKLDFVFNIYSSQWLTGRDKPQGRWAVTDGDSTVALVGHFDADKTDFTLLWNSMVDGFTLELVSNLVKLEPGATTRYRHAFEVISDRKDTFDRARPLVLKDTSWK